MTAPAMPCERRERCRRGIQESNQIRGPDADAVDGPVQNAVFRRACTDAAGQGFEHIGRLPVGIDHPLNVQIGMTLLDVFGLSADDHNDF